MPGRAGGPREGVECQPAQEVELAAPWSDQPGSEEHASLILAFVEYLVMQK